MFSRFVHACFSDFYHACYYCILLLVTAFSFLYFKRADKAFKWICVLITLTCLSELLAKYVGLCYGSNGIVYDIFVPIEYFIYANIYRSFLNSAKWNKILSISVGFLFVVDIINMIFFQPVKKVTSKLTGITTTIVEVPTNAMNVEMVMLVFLSLLLFINIREKPVYENITSEGVFWFNSAVLFYYSFSILIWGFYGVVYNMEDPPKISNNMLLLSSGLLYMLYVFSILLNSRYVNQLSTKNA